jgi:hypothetical protein
MAQQSASNHNVPEWNEYFPSLSEATVEQRNFYDYWIDEISKGNFLDLDGNISYIFVHLYSVIKPFIADRNLQKLVWSFDRIQEGYGNYAKVKEYLARWKGDAYLSLNDYENGWFWLRQGWFLIDDVVNVRGKCKSTSIDGQDFLKLLGSNNGLTEFGLDYIGSVIEHASVYLERFHHEHRKNWVEAFCDRYSCPESRQDLFIGYPWWYWDDGRAPSIRAVGIPAMMETAIKNEALQILRDCENTVRVEMSLPRIGEGWIRETELFYRLKEHLASEVVIQHARPSWLGRQHLDIYLPERNIGIEYQGTQHLGPVEYFGGDAAFKNQQERDERKKVMCFENNCKLIYVYENYCFDDVIRELELSFLQ